MLVLTIILVVTTDVNADTYTTSNTIISTNYHEFFKQNFKGKKYKYFPYNCYPSSSYNRTCYFGIDSQNNYIKISYDNSDDLVVTRGIDNNFILNGNNYFSIDDTNYLKIILIFICIIFLFKWFCGVIF